jgi:secreted PhoX family phosphatase
LRRFLNGPRGAEITGPAFTPDGATLFVSVQHPGAERGSTYDNPSSRWPDFRSDTPPRAAVLAITRPEGGEIGG